MSWPGSDNLKLKFSGRGHVVKGAAKVRLLTGAGLIDATVVKVDAANDLAVLKANAEGRMKNDETKQQPARDGGNSSFILLHSSFPLAGRLPRSLRPARPCGQPPDK